jgi:hypothetical protein
MKNKNGYVFALVLLLLTVGYGAFQARVLLHGPTLAVVSPRPGETISGTLMDISGSTEHVTHVRINGQPVTMDISGKFTQKLVTPEGYGVVLVEATNRFGHHIEERIEFVGQPISTNS